VEDGPVFIGGLERTGTSLLFALLASHPSLAMTRRTNWWTFFYGNFGDLAEDRNLDRCLGTMMRYRRHLKLQPDADRLRREFVAGERSYCRLFALLQAQQAERAGKRRWGDKSLNTERYAETVFGCFPNARIVHLIRDPRDRYASALKRWSTNRGGVGSATAAWIGSMALGERNEQAFPDRYRVLRYETLVEEPQATLRGLCDFIGEAYEPAMLQMEGAVDFRDSGGNSSFGRFAAGQISTQSVGRYRSVLNESQIAFIQDRAGEPMTGRGYELAEVRLSGARRLRYDLLDAPLNVGTMLAWRAREAVFDRTGRRPSAHTILAER
jgi:hypothetical protein